MAVGAQRFEELDFKRIDENFTCDIILKNIIKREYYECSLQVSIQAKYDKDSLRFI